MCQGSGQIAATLKRDKTVWAFACSCGASHGRKLSALYVTWNSKYRDAYEVEFDNVTYSPPQAPREPKKPMVDYKVRTANPKDYDDDLPF
jgi:acetylornithine/succinyldiaminopimelate/putrescine aminotransferase